MRIKPDTPRAQGSPASSAAIDATTLAHLSLIIFTWGSNYPLTKLALRDMGPLTFSAVRLAGGALVLAFIIAGVSHASLWPARGERVRLALSGILQFAGVLGFAALGLMFLPAGRTSVAVYSMPLWAAVFGIMLRGERLTIGQWIGVALGTAGLALFLDPAVLAEGSPLGTLLVFAAAASWGLGAVVHRGTRLVTPALSQTFFQLVCSTALLAVAAIIFEHDAPLRLTPALGAITLWNWLVPTSFGVWSWNRVLARLPAATAGQLVMATPLVGIACSALIFGETVPLAFGASCALVIGGALLVMKRGGSVARSVKEPPPPG